MYLENTLCAVGPGRAKAPGGSSMSAQGAEEVRRKLAGNVRREASGKDGFKPPKIL